MTAEIVRDPAALERWYEQWDELAVAACRPYCAPGWLLPWWQHLAPPGATLLTAVAHREGRLEAIYPGFGLPLRGGAVQVRPLGYDTHGLEPLARGRREDAASALAEAFANAPDAAVVRFESADPDLRWPEVLAAAWPGRRPALVRDGSLVAPVVTTTQGSFEAWLATKSPNFREQARRIRRSAAARGAVTRLATTRDELTDALEHFERLHTLRRRAESTRGLPFPAYRLAVRDAGERLLDAGRLRVWTLEADGEVVGAEVFLAAGDAVAYVNGGYDPARGDLRPGHLLRLAAIEDCLARGDAQLDLGGPPMEYKLRMADRSRELVWTSLFPRTPRSWLARAELAPERAVAFARATLRTRLDAQLRRRLRRTLSGIRR